MDEENPRNCLGRKAASQMEAQVGVLHLLVYRIVHRIVQSVVGRLMIEDAKMRKPRLFPLFLRFISHLLSLASHVVFRVIMVDLQADILYYSGRIIELYMTRELVICQGPSAQALRFADRVYDSSSSLMGGEMLGVVLSGTKSFTILLYHALY